MSKSAGIAILLSLTVHAFIAAVLIYGFNKGASPEVSVRLEVSGIELSIAATESETDAAVESVDSQPSAPVAEEIAPNSNPDEPQCVDGSPVLSPPILDVKSSLPVPHPRNPVFAAEAIAAPRHARVDAPPRPRCSIKPDYPRAARERGEQGEVRLEISVTADGTVAAAQVLSSSGFSALDEAALMAVRKTRFTPAQSAGQSVAATVRLTLSFRLR